MEVQANYIRRIEIHGLWHRYDIAWELRPDVNILSGINGVFPAGIALTIPDAVEPVSSSLPPWKQVAG